MKILNRSFIIPAALAAMVSAGCTLESPDVPPLTGPSTFALSVTVTASPDILPEDGVSQSTIRITVRDHNGQPVPNVPLRVDTMVGSTIVDFGTLSTRNVTTNASGTATVTFTAPRAVIPGFDSGTIVNITATAVGTDFASSFAHPVSIRLVPESLVQDPTAPRPSFTFTPPSPKVGDLVTYNGSGSSDPNGQITRYRWTFSDGHTEEGSVVSHDFTSAGTFLVTLTVTDNENKSASVTRAVTVTGS